jgi:hypothetical protein
MPITSVRKRKCTTIVAKPKQDNDAPERAAVPVMYAD